MAPFLSLATLSGPDEHPEHCYTVVRLLMHKPENVMLHLKSNVYIRLGKNLHSSHKTFFGVNK